VALRVVHQESDRGGVGHDALQEPSREKALELTHGAAAPRSAVPSAGSG
jgi:hypothetical protein